ncbi:winged helix-turn-helix transcriptional regulator [Nonomuraea diastatica]|nr:winged helix-turn-helix transcriptional regulator [Nonomuraea diastatica]
MTRSYGDPCGVARGLDVIGERWALLVVRDLLLGPKRFNDLLGGLHGASPNVLTQRLHDLIDLGVVRRRDLGPPARVRLYELTEWGHELEPLLLHLGRWGSQAPSPPQGELGIDSLLLSLKAGFDPARADELSGTYQLGVDGDTYLVRVADSSLQIERRAARQPSATLSTDLDTLRQVIDGRIAIPAAQQSSRLHIDGDEPSVRHLTDLLQP